MDVGRWWRKISREENCKRNKGQVGESNTEEKEAEIEGREGIKEEEAEKEEILNIAVTKGLVLLEVIDRNTELVVILNNNWLISWIYCFAWNASGFKFESLVQSPSMKTWASDGSVFRVLLSVCCQTWYVNVSKLFTSNRYIRQVLSKKFNVRTRFAFVKMTSIYTWFLSRSRGNLIIVCQAPQLNFQYQLYST